MQILLNRNRLNNLLINNYVLIQLSNLQNCFQYYETDSRLSVLYSFMQSGINVLNIENKFRHLNAPNRTQFATRNHPQSRRVTDGNRYIYRYIKKIVEVKNAFLFFQRKRPPTLLFPTVFSVQFKTNINTSSKV